MPCASNDWFAGWSNEEIRQYNEQETQKAQHKEMLNVINKIASNQQKSGSKETYYKEVADESTRLLCGLCGVLTDKQLTHLMGSELKTWYKNHLLEDKIRSNVSY